MLVQKFLETHSFKELQDTHGVYVSFSKYGHKFSLNYDQIEAKESDPLAQECRGLILSAENGNIFSKDKLHLSPGKTKILAFPMQRFFNYGQSCAADINWSDPKLSVLEKLDGTLCIVYYDPYINQWCVATRSVPDADIAIDNGTFTFRTLFEKALADTMNGISFKDFTNMLVKNITYCFELTSPYNQIVVKSDKCTITLLAVRVLDTLKELDPRDLALVQIGKVPVANTFNLSSINDIIDFVASRNPSEYEGVVVRDSSFRRIKIKNALYVLASRVKDNISASPRNIVEIILSGKDDDIMTLLSEDLSSKLLEYKLYIQNMIKSYDDIFADKKAEANALKPQDKKTFALLINSMDSIWAAPLFYMFDGKCKNMKDFIQQNNRNGTWANSFLDKILDIIKKNNKA